MSNRSFLPECRASDNLPRGLRDLGYRGARISRRAKGMTMVEMIVVMIIITILLALVIGAIGAYNRFSADKQTRTELAILDSVVDEYHTVTGKYPNIACGATSPYSFGIVTDTGGTHGYPNGANLAGSLVNFTATFNVTDAAHTGGHTVTQPTDTRAETYSMTQFLRQVEGVGNIGHSGLLDQTTGDPSSRSVVALNSTTTVADGMLAKLTSFASLNTATSYKNVTIAPLSDAILYTDGWGNPIFYNPSTTTASDPTSHHPSFGSCGPNGNFWITVNTGTAGSFNGVLTYTTSNDNILSSAGASQ